jgi:hypothetical protein
MMRPPSPPMGGGRGPSAQRGSVVRPPSPPMGGARNNDAEVMQTNNDAAVSRLCVD